MSKIIISAAIRGAHKIVDKCAAKLDEAIKKYGEKQEIGFPDTAYYLPIIYALMGTKIEKSQGRSAGHGALQRAAAAGPGRA